VDKIEPRSLYSLGRLETSCSRFMTSVKDPSECKAEGNEISGNHLSNGFRFVILLHVLHINILGTRTAGLLTS
jgi:hypothetical protein